MRYPLPGAEVKSLVADPRGGHVFYAGTAQGGVYRSTDAGRSWASGPGGQAFPGYAVTALVPDPLRPERLWAGLTGVVRGGALAVSDDHGATFTRLRIWEDRAAARVVAVRAAGAGRVVAVGGDYGVEISEDGGLTWRSSAPPLDAGSGISFLAFHPTKGDVLFCGSFRHPFRSLDGGRTWKRFANGMIEDTEVFALDFNPGNADDFWAATCGWVYRTTDGGSSWTRYREGLTDRRTHVVAHDRKDPSRILAGTTGGLFETRDAGKSFRRIGPELVVNALAFDPAAPGTLLVGTEAEGVLRSEDGGLTVTESNRGLSEARVSAVVELSGGRTIVARAADGKSGGLWQVAPDTGDVTRLPNAPPATVVALASSGERLVAATPDGIFVSETPTAPFTLVLARAARALASSDDRILAATESGVYESRDGGRRWGRLGTLAARVDGIRRARFARAGVKTWAADSGGRTLWWDGRDWVFEAVRAEAGKKLTGGFGRASAGVQWVPEPVGLEVDAARGLLLFRPEEDGADGIALATPEKGLSIAGWSGDPRRAEGLFLATIGRGLFRFVADGVQSPPPVVATR